MTIEQLHEIIQRIEVITESVAADPKIENNAYNRCIEKVLTHLEESRMWIDKSLNIRERVESELSKKSNQ